MTNHAPQSGRLLIMLLIAPALYLSACGNRQVTSPEETMNSAAEAYVKLVLAMGRFDENYIDAYTGPAEWQQEVDAEGRELLCHHEADVGVGHDDRLGEAGAAREPLGGGLEQAGVIHEPRELLGVALARDRPEPCSGTATKNDRGNCLHECLSFQLPSNATGDVLRNIA